MAPPATVNGIITLLTDFGQKDPFVGVMKGVIYGRFPAANVVDLMHGVGPQDVLEASFWLTRSYPWFPAGTVHVVVVDPGVGTERAVLVLRADGHLFVGPDNGVMDGVFARARDVEAREVDIARFGLHPPSNTFHGRDVFAPVAAELAAGRAQFEELGRETQRVAGLPAAHVHHTSAGLQAAVVTVDHFGNLITNLDAELVPEGPGSQVRVGEARCPLVRTYGDVEPGQLLALINSFGTVEIACRNGSAAAALGVGRGTRVTLERTQARRP